MTKPTRKKTWPKERIQDFIDWHESVIAQYPEAVQTELRTARDHWLPVEGTT
jgi:hypothetical protein